MIKKIIRSFFDAAGLDIRRKRCKTNGTIHFNQQMNFGLERISKLDLTVNTIVDVGAAQGSWALSAKNYWPHASYILFEPLEERRDELEQLSHTNHGFYFVPQAAGKEKGVVQFSVASDLDGSGVASNLNSRNVRAVNVTSIQEEVRNLKLMGPYFIKLDTHGYELPILDGCKNIMDEVSLFIIECYGFQIAKDSLLFWEMCQHMDSKGFRLFDLVDVMRRAKDGAFWQCDAFFISKDSALFKDNSYA